MYVRWPRSIGAGLALAAWLGTASDAEEWPTWRHDARRSGVSGEKLRWPLAEQWTFTPLHPPEPAWDGPPPKPIEAHLEFPRLGFDTAFHVAAVGDSVFFGSSADGKVYALQAADGTIRWEFFTGGPVRLAPTVAEGRVFFGSDGGRVEAVGLASGRCEWGFATGAAVSGAPAVAGGRLVVMAEDGAVYCFGDKSAALPPTDRR